MNRNDPGEPDKPTNKKFIKILAEWSSFELLIADDDDDDLDFFEKAFKEVAPDYSITKINRGEEIIKKLHSSGNLPDLVVLDLNMPARNGFEILKDIRHDNKLSKLPVMVYSTTANPEQVKKTFELGANMYLQKPNSYQDIKSLIQKILSLDPAYYIPQAPQEEFLYKVNGR